ncbi:MAG: RNA methyltransferase [Ardenticatenales bacterium]|nr:RNA methyltransferase [Ardenticatenales bacterium]
MIESIQNSKVKWARALQRRRERQREGKLFVEGVRLVGDAVATGITPDLLFFTQAALETARVQSLVEAHGPVAWEVSEAVMTEMAGTVTPQGVAAIVPLPALPWPEQPTLLLIADGVRDPGNLGTLLRSAAAAGVEGVIVPRGTVDPWADKVLRAGMGAHFRLPIYEGLTWDAVLSLLTGLTVRLGDAQGDALYDQVDWTLPSALIIGGEASGAGEAARQRTDEIITISMANAVESLNAAVAGSVMMFEAFRQRRMEPSG